MKTSTLPAGPAGDRSMDWLDHAACRRSDPELFFPVTDIRAARAQVEAAKKVCRHCPVKGICLSWAMDNGQEAGSWRRSSSVVPPQIPASCPLSIAQLKQIPLTGQWRHTFLAASTWARAALISVTGKNSSGSERRHAAWSSQSMLRSPAGPAGSVDVFIWYHTSGKGRARATVRSGKPGAGAGTGSLLRHGLMG